MLHLVRCRHTKVLWKNCLKFCHKVLEAPDMTDRPERAVIFNQDKEKNMLQKRHAPSSDTHSTYFTMTSLTSKKVTPSFGKTSITEPSQPFEGRRCDTRGKSDYNTPTGYTPTLQRRYRKRAEKIRANNRDRHHRGLRAHARLQRRDHSCADQPQGRIRCGQEEPRNSSE